jgi:hypothetical protein
MKRILGLVVLVSLVVPTVASAQSKGAPAKRSDSCAEQRKKNPNAVCTLDIEGSELDGERVTPNGEQILAHPPAKFGSLIRYRESMVDKMARDVERF